MATLTRVLPTDLDRSARDFDSLKDRLARAAQSVFPSWTDYSQANFGVVLLEGLCYIGDVLGYYQDRNARESRFATCVRRVNGLRHGRVLGYTFEGATAATVDLRVTLRAARLGDTVFTRDAVVRSTAAADPVRVRLLNDLTIPAGDLVGTVAAEHSLAHVETFTANDEADQQFELSYSPFLAIEELTDGAGVFSVVDNFLDSTSTDRHVVVRVDEDGRALLVFGDGINGRVATGELTVRYTTGGGEITIEAGTLTVPEFTVVDETGTPAPFDVTNPAGSSGGGGAETLAHAQAMAPASVRVGDRSVSRDDFEANARRVSGVSRTLMLTSDQYAGIPENYGQLRVIARGAALASGRYAPTLPTSAQLAEVAALIANDYPPTVTFRFDVIAGTFKVVDVTARVYLATGANPATVDAAIRSRLADYFAVEDSEEAPNPTVDFGYNYRDELGNVEALLAWSDLFTLVAETSGVRRVDEDAFVPADDVGVAVYEFPRLGTVTLINARTGLPLV